MAKNVSKDFPTTRPASPSAMTSQQQGPAVKKCRVERQSNDAVKKHRPVKDIEDELIRTLREANGNLLDVNEKLKTRCDELLADRDNLRVTLGDHKRYICSRHEVIADLEQRNTLMERNMIFMEHLLTELDHGVGFRHLPVETEIDLNEIDESFREN